MPKSQWLYQIDNFIVHPNTRQVVVGDKICNVRPKTFALLMLLLENEYEVLSKDFIIQRIWDDVKVEEQVLVQSIRELRQMFSPLDVIQTHPRKGYAWVASVKKIEGDTVEVSIPDSHPTKARTMFPLFLSVAVLLLAIIGFYKFYSPSPTKTSAKEIITILPINNRMEGTNLAWVRLGIMDQLIQSLKISQSYQVFDASYVLRLLETAKVDQQQRLSLVNRVFEISGSSLVVDAELSGSINDYRLRYHLYTPTTHTSGVLNDHQLDNLVASLAQIIAKKSKAGLNAQKLKTEFNSGLLAEATEKWDQGQHESAIALLNTLISLEPDNFLAYQLLIEFKEKLEDWSGAVDLANRVIPLAEQYNFARTHVFYFLLAEAENAQAHEEAARVALKKSQLLAEAGFDILYQAYVAGLWGDMAFSAGRYEDAEAYYQASLGLHQSIACPIGMSVVHSKFIELYASNGKSQLLATHVAALKELLGKHHLALDFSTRVKSHIDSAIK